MAITVKIMKLDLQEGDMPEKCREVERGHPGAKVVSAAHVWIEGQEASITAFGLRLPNESKTVEPLGEVSAFISQGGQLEKDFECLRRELFGD